MSLPPSGDENAALGQPQENEIKLRFEYFSAHFVAFSAIATAYLSLNAAALMFGYVTALDIHLLTLVQYSDILPFVVQTILYVLAALAVMAFYGLSLRGNVDPSKRSAQALRRFVLEGSTKWLRRFWISLFILSCFNFLIAFFATSLRTTLTFKDYIYLVQITCFPFGVFVIALIVTAHRGLIGRPAVAGFLLFNLMTALFMLGTASATFNLATTRPYEVTTKSGHHYPNVIIALTLSRGTVLYDRNAKDIVIIPENDIEQIIPHKE